MFKRFTAFSFVAAAYAAAGITLGGCAGQYAVTKSNDVASEITLPGAGRLVSIREDGSWLWRKKPEEVVKALAGLAQQEQKKIDELQAKLDAASAPAKPGAPEPKK